MRKITVYSTVGKSKQVIDSDSLTWGQLKKELSKKRYYNRKHESCNW